MIKIPKFSDIKTTKNLYEKMAKTLRSNEIALVKNPEYIYQMFEAYMLAPKIRKPLRALIGIVCDMDGTTTTTETLCLHSQEWMMRKITNRESTEEWKGLDHEKDYPNIIGNSTTKHIEYLINTYAVDIREESMKSAYIACSLWTILIGKDNGRKREAIEGFKVFGIDGIIKERECREISDNNRNDQGIKVLSDKMSKKYLNKFKVEDFHDIVRVAIEIYYYRYHSILVMLEEGRGKGLSKELFGDENKRLIDPMSGVGIYLAAIKGWLGKDIGVFYDKLKAHVMANSKKKNDSKKIITKIELITLGRYFEKNPAKISIVTSSIFYEANIVLTEVFKVLYEEIKKWKISKAKKTFLKKKFSKYMNIYDSFITASDSSEIRLKPHRDLFSIALHKMGIMPENFDKVVGFEDSESGTIAIRAAGIGKCVAVPFKDTAGHNLTAASHILRGGLPEALIAHNGFIEK